MQWICKPEMHLDKNFSCNFRRVAAQWRMGEDRFEEPHPDSLEATKRRLYRLRMALGLQPAQMAKRLDISLSRWSNIESPNSQTDLSKEVAWQICKRIPGVSYDWLWHGNIGGMSVEMLDRIERVEMPATITKRRGRQKNPQSNPLAPGLNPSPDVPRD